MSVKPGESDSGGGGDRRPREIAVALMRMALAPLDRAADEGLAAARLQHALDTLEQRRPGCPTDAELKTFGP